VIVFLSSPAFRIKELSEALIEVAGNPQSSVVVYGQKANICLLLWDVRMLLKLGRESGFVTG
jgi:hypothetical protein